MTMRCTLTVLAVCSFVPACKAQEFYVRFDTPAEATAAGAWQPGLMPPGVWNWYHLERPDETRSDVAADLGAPLENVQRIGQGEVSPADEYTPEDPFFSAQWHHGAIKTLGAHRHTDVSNLRRTVRVAVVDSGIWSDHEDIRVRDGWSPWMGQIASFPELSPFFDRCRHGTHVAGLVGAETNNGIGVAGVSTIAELYSLRCLDWCGGTLADVTDAAIIGAVFFDCEILSVSLQWSSPYQPWTELCDLMEARGTFMVVAAGNYAQAQVSQAAMPSWCIAVGAVDDHGVKAEFSNYGTGLDMVAPGVAILSTMIVSQRPGGALVSSYETRSGTSMATPLVSGALANMLSATPSTVAPQEIRAALIASCDPHKDTWLYGAGYLNASRAVISVKPCLADLDLSGAIDIFDVLTFADAFAKLDPLADLTADGQFDMYDWLAYQDASVSTACGK